MRARQLRLSYFRPLLRQYLALKRAAIREKWRIERNIKVREGEILGILAPTSVDRGGRGWL